MTQNAYLFDMIMPGVSNPPIDEINRRMIEFSKRDNKLPISYMEPEEIANAVAFLCSEEGRMITGTALDITAGTSSTWSA